MIPDTSLFSDRAQKVISSTLFVCFSDFKMSIKFKGKTIESHAVKRNLSRHFRTKAPCTRIRIFLKTEICPAFSKKKLRNNYLT